MVQFRARVRLSPSTVCGRDERWWARAGSVEVGRSSVRSAGGDWRPVWEEIRDNLIARIAEAEREGWLGEVEGLRVSLAGADEKLTQLDARLHRRSSKVFLGVPSIEQTGARDLDTSRHVGRHR
ncbi:hypothetical protein [Streptomyces kanasensis]|uniref:hypothetical protein n=1 Tax=Streptomyces kanasensis TaxID=936756 RepID=UPI00381D9BF1